MKTIFLVLALVYVAQADPPVVSVVASDEEVVPIAVPGGVNFLPPPYDDVMGKMCKIRADCFEVSRILAVYEQVVAGLNYWVFYQKTSGSLCVLKFFETLGGDYVDPVDRCFYHLPMFNQVSAPVLVKKLASRAVLPVALRSVHYDYWK